MAATVPDCLKTPPEQSMQTESERVRSPQLSHASMIPAKMKTQIVLARVMGDVISFTNNEIEKGLRELALKAGSEKLDYCLVISQREVDGYLEWTLDEIGEKTIDHDHITSLLGHLFSFSQHVFIEMMQEQDLVE